MGADGVARPLQLAAHRRSKRSEQREADATLHPCPAELPGAVRPRPSELSVRMVSPSPCPLGSKLTRSGELPIAQARHPSTYPACESRAVRSQSDHGRNHGRPQGASRALLDGGREPGAVSKVWPAHSDQIARHCWRSPTKVQQREMRLAAPWIRRRGILVSDRVLGVRGIAQARVSQCCPLWANCLAVKRPRRLAVRRVRAPFSIGAECHA